MTARRDAIEESYRACRSLVRRSGSNFTGSFWMLPSRQRRAMYAIYAFMRHTDDLVDLPAAGNEPAAALAAWRRQLEEALANEPIDNALAPPSRFAAELPATALPPPARADARRNPVAAAAILPALADTIAEFRIPAGLFFEVIEGVEMDLQPRRFARFAELEQYCDRVAGAVGLACIHIWGFRGPEAFEPARQCGLAMQLTNILRDLGEDLRQGRLYLPEEDLAAHGCTAEDLFARKLDDRTLNLIEFEARRAARHFREAARLTPLLSPPGSRIYRMINGVYQSLLGKIARQPADVFRYRLSVSRWRKLWIAAASLFRTA